MKKVSEITEEEEQMLYEDVIINGMTWPVVARRYDLTALDAMRVFDNAMGKLKGRYESNSEAYKSLMTSVLFETIAIAKNGLELSRSPKVKTVTKTGNFDESGNEIVLTEITEEPHAAGDPRWVGQMLTAVKQLTDMNVLSLPRQIEVDIKSQHEIKLVQQATTEQLENESALYDLITEGVRSGLITIDAHANRIEQSPVPVEQAPPTDSLPF